MKFLHKILFSLLFFIVLYIVLIFLTPNFADTLGRMTGLEGFNNKVRELKGGLDEQSTKNFGVDELLSGATDLKNKAVNGIQDVRNGINEVRGSVDSTVKTYEDVKNQAEEVVNTINKTTEQIDDFKNGLENTLNGTNNKRLNDLRNKHKEQK